MDGLPTLKQVFDTVRAGGRITRQQARFLVSDACDHDELVDCAGQLRASFCGDEIHRCAIVNARSGNCSEDCSFCAQSARHMTETPTYPLLAVDALLANARQAYAAGVTCFGIVTSGRAASDADIEVVAEVVGRCREMGLAHVGASLGILSRLQIERLQQAGLRHYNHNLETSRSFYPQVCTSHSWDERYQTVQAARQVGLEVCCGGILGLGESWDDRIDLALALCELEVENVPLNFLTPVAGTPLDDAPAISADEGLRAIALFRFLLPRATIRICGGRPVTFAGRQADIFTAGASGILTGDYLTTVGSSFASDRELIERAGLCPARPRPVD